MSMVPSEERTKPSRPVSAAQMMGGWYLSILFFSFVVAFSASAWGWVSSKSWISILAVPSLFFAALLCGALFSQVRRRSHPAADGTPKRVWLCVCLGGFVALPFMTNLNGALQFLFVIGLWLATWRGGREDVKRLLSGEESPPEQTSKTAGLGVLGGSLVLFALLYNALGLAIASLLFGIPVCVVLLGALIERWEDVRWERWAREATQLEARGLLTQASLQWDVVAERAPRGSFAWGDVTLRQAWVTLREGKGAQALDVLEPVLSSKDTQERELARSLSLLVHALEGRLPEAESLLEELTEVRVLGGVVGGLGPQVLLLRHGEFQEALARAVPPWDIAEPECRHFRHVWALLRAFALEHLSPVPQRDLQRTRAELRDLRPKELGYLTAHWPELQAFLDAHLATLAGAPPSGGTSEAPASTGPRSFKRTAFGLGLPAQWDPESTAYEPLRAVWLLVLLGGWVSLPFMNDLSGVHEVLLVAVLGLATFMGLALPLRLSFGRWGPNHKGIEALAELRLEDARRCFEQVLKKSPESPVARLNLASVLYRLGERSLARRLFHALAQHVPKGRGWVAPVLSLDYLAECEATEGNLGRARMSAELADNGWQGRRPYRNLSLEVLLALREGDAELVSELAGSQQRIDMGAHYRRRMMLLHAFMLEQVEHPTPEQREEYWRLHAQLREQGVPGEFDYLAPEWPELWAFLESLGKARTTARAEG